MGRTAIDATTVDYEETQPHAVNLNHHVQVRLTEYGVSVLRESLRRDRKSYWTYASLEEERLDLEAAIESFHVEGDTYQFRLHELMHHFGDDLGTPRMGNLPFVEAKIVFLTDPIAVRQADNPS